MRQTPFGVWNPTLLRQRRAQATAPMRQTPFGVWNKKPVSRGGRERNAPMRQTPFGVWNEREDVRSPSRAERSNEADAFRRLEYSTSAA